MRHRVLWKRTRLRSLTAAPPGMVPFGRKPESSYPQTASSPGFFLGASLSSESKRSCVRHDGQSVSLPARPGKGKVAREARTYRSHSDLTEVRNPIHATRKGPDRERIGRIRMHHITEKCLQVRSLQGTSAVGILPPALERRLKGEHTATTPSPLGPKRVLSRSQTSSLLPGSRNRQGQSHKARSTATQRRIPPRLPLWLYRIGRDPRGDREVVEVGLTTGLGWLRRVA